MPVTSDAPTVVVTDLVVRHQGTDAAAPPAVDGANVRLEPGEVLALVGPNGAGKTTTCRAIEGALAPTSGRVEVFGLDPRLHRRALADRWGIMPQTGGLPMGLTAGECVQLFAALHGRSSAHATAVLDTMGLTSLADQRWRRLSGGEQQRVSVAVALCGGEDLLVLDEPTAAVDAAGRERVLELIRSRASSGAGVLLTTHRFDDVEAVADRVVVMHRGQVVTDGPLAELIADESVRFEAAAELDRAALAAAVGLPVDAIAERAPGRYVVSCAPEPAMVGVITAWLSEQGLVASSMSAGRVPLDERFAELTTAEDPDAANADDHAAVRPTPRGRRRGR